MSLSWNGAYIEKWADISLAQKTAFIYATMAIGVGQITKERVPVVYGRMKLLEKLNGYWWMDDDVEHVLTINDVKDMVGLNTNAYFGVEPKTKWLKRILKGYTLSAEDPRVKAPSVRIRGEVMDSKVWRNWCGLVITHEMRDRYVQELQDEAEHGSEEITDESGISERGVAKQALEIWKDASDSERLEMVWYANASEKLIMERAEFEAADRTIDAGEFSDRYR